ncbi:MAG: CDP-alcohol phosphatidyltransferase family protein, partial [Myxococcota bacterium]
AKGSSIPSLIVFGAGLWAIGALALHGLTASLLLTVFAFAGGLAVAARFARDWNIPNVVTSIRLGLISYVAGALVSQLDATLWGLALVALALDGVDGFLARRFGQTTDFGARFDMETDAAFILVLAALVWSRGGVGSWVLAMGLLRYLFVALGFFWRFLRAPLPPSFVRKAVCVVQVLVLLVALFPGLDPSLGAELLMAAFALLIGSFGKDIFWLVANRAQATAPPHTPPTPRGTPGGSRASNSVLPHWGRGVRPG